MDKVDISVYTEVVLGNDLDDQRISLMKPYWDHEGWKSLDKPSRHFYVNDIFFLVRSKDTGKLLSMGRLRPFTITFQSNNYQILGISDITSIIQGQGYGKILVSNMIDYLENDKRTAIGFCAHHNENFYRKCGLGVIKDSVDRFLYWDNKKLQPETDQDEDTIYYQGEDRLISKILEHPEDKILITVPHW